MEKDDGKACPLIVERESDVVNLGLHGLLRKCGVRTIGYLLWSRGRLRSYGATYTIRAIPKECDESLS